ncbi:MAG: LysM peptidoglycan-binding domain-containing protein [Roseibacillus sp.]|nr:LysM peptidoglycan-binding domain-containing protein [Roseibacillus sp.]
MRALPVTLSLLLGPATLMAEGRSELEILRARCSEQERQIRTLETDIENLHSHLALERRRARGIHTSVSPALNSGAVKTCAVTTGDTLSSIARRYNTSVDSLMKINGITDPTRLRIGQKLTLPAEAASKKEIDAPKAVPVPEEKTVHQAHQAAAKPKAPANLNAREYTVERGDTLYGIARRHKISVSSLRSLNPDIADKIVVGQKISITGKAKATTPRPPANRQVPTSTRKPKAQVAAAKDPGIRKPAQKNASLSKAQPASIAKKKAPAPAPKQLPSALRQKKSGSTESFHTPKSISSIFVTEEVSFGNFAKRHGTTPEQLNALNGWNFRSSLVLAKGSEIYVPGR